MSYYAWQIMTQCPRWFSLNSLHEESRLAVKQCQAEALWTLRSSNTFNRTAILFALPGLGSVQLGLQCAHCRCYWLSAINLTILNHSEPWKSAWSVLHVVRLSQGQRKAKLSMAVLNTHSGRAVVIQHIPTPMTFDAWELVTWKNVMNLHPQRCLNVHVSMSPHYLFVCWGMAKCRRWLVQLNMVR